MGEPIITIHLSDYHAVQGTRAEVSAILGRDVEAYAREVLKDPHHYNFDCVDAAFDILSYSTIKSDHELCRNAEEFLDEPIPVTVLAVCATLISVSLIVLSVMFAQVLL